MKSLLRLRILPVLAGLFVAFITMMLFEGTNSLFHPFPEGMDTTNLDEVRAFAETLPLVAFLVVLFGWACGALLAGMTVTKIAQKDVARAKSLTLVTGSILTLLGIVNNFIFLPGVQPLWFTILGLPLFLLFSFIGYRIILRV